MDKFYMNCKLTHVVEFVKAYFKKLNNDIKDKEVVSTLIENHMNFLDVFIKWINHRFDTRDIISIIITILLSEHFIIYYFTLDIR